MTWVFLEKVMLPVLFVGSVTVVAIVSLFRLLTYISKRNNDMTPLEVARRIQNHIEEAENPWDWDQFTSLPITNKRLDAIRLRCIELDAPVPISPERRAEFSRMVQHLKSGDGYSPK
jgi:hypothetical protein